MKRLFARLKYPKILILILSFGAAYLLFSNSQMNYFIENLGKLRYLGTFISGMLFSFGFTAPFALGYLATLNPANIWMHGIIGGLGAMISNLFIFGVIRGSFMDEFKRLEKTKTLKFISRTMNRSLGARLMNYIMFSIAGIVIASPLPDEVGVTMLAGLTKINTFILGIISFVLSTLGIIVFLMI